MAAPEVFALRDEDGHSYVTVTEFTPDMIEAARRAASTCPEQAIVIAPLALGWNSPISEYVAIRCMINSLAVNR